MSTLLALALSSVITQSNSFKVTDLTYDGKSWKTSTIDMKPKRQVLCTIYTNSRNGTVPSLTLVVDHTNRNKYIRIKSTGSHKAIGMTYQFNQGPVQTYGSLIRSGNGMKNPDIITGASYNKFVSQLLHSKTLTFRVYSEDVRTGFKYVHVPLQSFHDHYQKTVECKPAFKYINKTK